MAFGPGAFCLVFFCLAILAGCATSAAKFEDFAVVVHSDNALEQIGRESLRNHWLIGGQWPNGEEVKPVNLRANSELRRSFVTLVLRTTPERITDHWRVVGEGKRPPEVESVTDVVQYVAANPGAVGYIGGDVELGDGVRFLTVTTR